MKNERTIAITLVVIIILLLSALIVLTNKDIFENLFSEGKAIKYNDCVDIHYIGKHENGGIFAYSYDNLTKKTGENTLKIFVTNSSSAAPPKDFETYSNNFSYSNPYDFSGEKQYYFEELIQSLVGMKKGETKTIGPITPVGNFGVEPEIGDKIDLSALVGVNNTIYSVFDKQEDVPIPEEYKADLGDITTTLYTLRQEFYKVGDSMDAMYPFWKNSSVVTKINETLIWVYTTSATGIGENFTWSETSTDASGQQIVATFPENSSAISSMNESTIVVTHTPEINSTIQESYNTIYGAIPGNTYTINNVTDDVINTSYQDQYTGNTSYKEFNRTSIIERNQTQTIIMDSMPAEVLEPVLSYLRDSDPDFIYGCSPFIKPIYLDIKVIEIHKKS